MKPKRRVSANLGRTQHGRADKLYAGIRKRIGPTRKCPFYNGHKYPQFSSNEHDKLNPVFPNPNVPIEQFDFALNKTTRKWGLQAYCKVCYKAYRDARISKSRATWVHTDGSSKSDNEIRGWYRKHVAATMICSACKRRLDPGRFRISRSMEKGLHNICFGCEAARGISVREQEWLADGDWASWTRAVIKLRRRKRVKCAGWSRSVEIGECLRFGPGKSMHADHDVPLRAGGIHDAKNLQSLCSRCNERKSDQIDPAMPVGKIRKLVGANYTSSFRSYDSIPTIERKLKAAVVFRIGKLIKEGKYLDALKAKKKEVNGQWDVNRAYRKGTEWFKRVNR